MTYSLEESTLLFEIDRRKITDIMPGDVLEATGFPAGQYTWTEQDSQFVENNPGANVFLKLQKAERDYESTGILILPED